MKLEQQHQQHEAGTSTSTTQSWKNNINSNKMRWEHQQ
jgi:hypothetical protein